MLPRGNITGLWVFVGVPHRINSRSSRIEKSRKYNSAQRNRIEKRFKQAERGAVTFCLDISQAKVKQYSWWQETG